MKIKAFFKLLRLFDAKGYFLFCLFGFLLAKGFNFPLTDILIFWILVFLGAGFAFSINECFDQKEDKFNFTKENPILKKEITFKRATIFSLSLAFLGLIIAFFYSFEIFLFSLFGGLLIFFYSAPPLRFKSNPPLDILSHGLFGGTLLVAFPFFFFKTEIYLFHIFIFILAFFVSVLLELRNEYEDFEADKLGGVRTTAHILGKEKTKKIINFLILGYLFLLFSFFGIFVQKFLFVFFSLILIFLAFFLFFPNFKFTKNYKLLDFFNVLSWSLILLAKI